MYFRVLGPVEVQVDGRRLQPGGARQRVLLAVLLLHANRVVSVDRLVDALWGDAPPTTATAQIHGRISALRRMLADGGAGTDVITTRAPGYLIRVEPEQLDLEVFERAALDAQRALGEGEAELAATAARGALELWRGPALADVVGPVVESAAAGLEERRLTVLETRIEAELALGRHAELVAELAALVSEHPLRERLRAQLMLALYRCGRRADALAVYREARQVLVAELGLEPGPQLQRLEQAILTGDPALELAAPAAKPAAPTTRLEPRPAQLPADIADFTGRDKQVGELYEPLAFAAETGADQPGAVDRKSVV